MIGRYLAFYSFDFKLESANYLGSYNDFTEAIAAMQNGHAEKFVNDFRWERESGLIFDLEEDRYYKIEEFVWKEKLEIPDTYKIALSSFINREQ